MEMKKMLPIGIEAFKEFRTDNFYYVDKTGFISELMQIREVIPNKEVLEIYEKKISVWFQRKAVRNTSGWRRFCVAFKEGDGETVQNVFNEFMAESISIRDTFVRKEMKENFYHGLLLGLLRAEGSWIVKSNVESGSGSRVKSVPAVFRLFAPDRDS